MSDLDRIIQVNIFRETSAIATASFGLPLIIAEFLPAKTTPAFGRYREYGSVGEMADDGWLVSDEVYQKAQIIFSQNPKIPKLAVGRKESTESWTASLNAITNVSNEWYGLLSVTTGKAVVLFSEEFVDLNNIVATVNGIVCDPVVYTTSHANTMSLLKAEIESKVVGSTVTVSSNELTIELANGSITAVNFVITLGLSQPTFTVDITDEDDILEIAAWVEANQKLFGVLSADVGVLDPAVTTDLASQLKALGYIRTFVNFHLTGQRLDAGIIGKMFPDTPGRATWCYKNISGVSTYSIGTGAKTSALGKNANIYTNIGGAGRYEQGKVAVGEYIDVIWGLDYLKSELQVALFSELANVSDKVPFSDEGIQIITGIVEGVLNRFAGNSFKLLQGGSISVTAPAYVDISSNDKANRVLPDVEWEALLQGAIHFIKVRGVVSV